MSERTPKLLVVDDDPRLRDLLRRYLGENGFQVFVADNGVTMNRLWLRERFDALILDLMMPGEDGLQILRRLREQKDTTPIIMLTARGEDVDRIVGLEMGADDYIPKPFNPRELLARIHAVLRRRPAADAPGAPSMTDEVVKFGEFELDLGTRVLRKNGEPVPLTTGEFAVLKAFARHPKQPLSRDKLMEIARGLKPSARGELEITDVNLEYLRRGQLQVVPLEKDFTWLDAGTAESLLDAGRTIKEIQDETGRYVGCLEELGLQEGWITADHVHAIGDELSMTLYGKYLQCL